MKEDIGRVRHDKLVVSSLHPSETVQDALLKKNDTSFRTVIRKPKKQFVREMEGVMSEKEASHVYEKAKSNAILLAHAAAAVSTTKGSGAYRALHARLSGNTEGKATFEDIPSYQEIYGSLDYCSCPKCKSIFGPAAYFVDFMRIVSTYIELEDGQALPLKERRPDLYDLELTCENTNQTEPYLNRVNAILEKYLEKEGIYQDLYRELAESCRPYPLPFCLPLTEIRINIKQAKLTLKDVFSALLLPEESIWMEEKDVTPDVYDYLTKPLSEEKMQSFWGFTKEDAQRLADVSVFKKEMGLGRQELNALLFQDIGENEDKRTEKLHGLYLNQGLDDGEYLSIEDEKIQNLNQDTLERICGFLRMCKTFGTEYDKMDWLIETAGYDTEGGICIFTMGQIQKTADIFSLSVEEASAFFGNMKDYGSNLFSQVYGMGRPELDNLGQSLKEKQIQKSLEISKDAYQALMDYFGKEPDDLPDAVYRHVKLAHLLGMKPDVWVRFLSLAYMDPVTVFTPAQVFELAALCKELPYSIYELEYLVNLTESPYLAAGISLDSLTSNITALRQGAESLGDTSQQEDYVYGQLGQMVGQTSEDTKRLFALVLTDEALADWPSNVLHSSVEEAIKPVVDKVFRLAYLVGKDISIQLLETEFSYKEAFGITDDNMWTLQSVRYLTLFAIFMQQYQDQDGKLLSFVEAYAKDKDISLLAEVCGWEEAETSAVLRLLYADGEEEANIVKLMLALHSCMACKEKLSVDASAMGKLSRLAYRSDGGYDAGTYYDTAKTCKEALFGDVWSTETEASIAEKKRDALLPAVMQRLQETYGDITNYNKLYKFFLIDVEMDEKTMISPVKEGINALQLYMQRCRLRLEKGISEISIPHSWWDWIMDYRMWEANRRIFVYPENYLVPSVRKSKTQLFQNTEDALCQSKITDGYIEEQYVKYLDGYLELTQLKICGAYETEEDYTNVLYVFARTKTQPYSYYYCRKASTLAWSEWTKIDTNIDAENITPVFVFNRLHIFWTVVKENTKAKLKSGDALDAGNEQTETLQIKYTYRNLQGQWITPQNLQEEMVIYNQEDSGAEAVSEAAGQLGLSMDDNNFQKLTLLRLTHKNLDGVMDKGSGFECLAVITGSFTQNLAKFMEELDAGSTMEQEQYAFTKALNRMIQSDNFEIHNGEDGFFSTGYFKLFNEELEEIHLVHPSEFIVVDGYTTPNHSLIYKPVHDAVHHAVGLMLSQHVLEDAALPTNGILPFDNQKEGPVLEKHAFSASDASGTTIISQEMSEKIYERLENNDFIVDSRASQSGIANQSLQYVLDDLLIDREKNGEEDYAARLNQIQHIQDVLLKNLGAVYLFKNAEEATVLPVVNQPGKFIYDCGDEAFLIYPVYSEEEDNGSDSYHPVHICKVEKGVTIGVPVTVTTFVKLGFERLSAMNIYNALSENGLLNDYGIVNMDACTREKLSEVLADVLEDDDRSKYEKHIDLIYVKLQNYPVIKKSAECLSKDGVTDTLLENKVLYQWMDEKDTYRIDLSMLQKKNQIQFTDAQGAALDAKEEAKVYAGLKAAVSSVNFNYRLNDDLPDAWKELPFSAWKFGVQRMTNPTIKKLKRKLETGGIPAFLNRETQSEPKEPIMPFSRLEPGDNIIAPKTSDGAQIDFEGLYAEYNWELFYHIPILIAQSFRTNSLYEDSMKWFHYIFDPTKKKDDSIQRYYWNFYPFSQTEAQQLEKILTDQEAIQAYNDSPFDPHAIARLRIDAYGKYTIMEYVSNLIAWADSQFIENTWESLTQATMLYVWANDLLGPKPEQVGEHKQQTARSYAQIEEYYGDPANIPQFLIDLEEKIAEMTADTEAIPVRDDVPFLDVHAYFGVPENAQFMLLWDIVEDRLYKLRNSLDINGVPRVTALYEESLDPMVLVKAASSGADTPFGVLTKQCSRYPYRFTYLIEEAKSITSLLMQFSSGLLSALEKNDAEAMLLLSGTQEETLLDMALSIKENQVGELEKSQAALEVSVKAAQRRLEYYNNNAQEYMSEKEIAGFATSVAAGVMDTVAGGMALAAGAARLAPQVGSPFAMKYGGVEVGSSIEAFAHGCGIMAGVLAQTSQQTMAMAGYDRRKEEWQLQGEMAENEIENLKEQIAACQERLKSAQKDLEIHKKTQEQKKEVLAYLKKKFTGTQLYQWLSSHLSGTAWQVYQLALELGLTAQEAYQYERDTSDTFLKYDYWDSGRKGLMAGEGLMLSLVQMQQAFLKKDGRRLEIEKHISLAADFPEALENLKKNGNCQFALSESLFAQDYPGGYRRKIKSVSLTVPAVLPPYENIRAILKQQESKILLCPDEKGIDYLFGLTEEDPGNRIVKHCSRSGEKIAVSKGVDDSGVFALDFSDPRYLPFEGTGVASDWYLEMPLECNHFSLDTITDIILCIKYTALEDEQRSTGSFYEYVAGKVTACTNAS